MVCCTKANIEYIISHQNNSLLAVIVETIHLYYSQVEICSIYYRNVIRSQWSYNEDFSLKLLLFSKNYFISYFREFVIFCKKISPQIASI